MSNDKWDMIFFFYSIIRNKCGTLATAPRIDAVSGRSTI